MSKWLQIIRLANWISKSPFRDKDQAGKGRPREEFKKPIEARIVLLGCKNNNRHSQENQGWLEVNSSSISTEETSQKNRRRKFRKREKIKMKIFCVRSLP